MSFFDKDTYDFLNEGYSGYLDYLVSSDDSSNCSIGSWDDFEIVDCPEDHFFDHDSYNMLY